jgi:alkanesulfonate monooxygenase SsuD/methylene tetrahydromethanopterin reductase-like flavin-dependent oxidoreductase (luciferase family)
VANVGLSASFATSVQEWMSHCRRAEQVGLATMWCGDSGRDGFVYAAAALAATSAARVGTAISLPSRSPLQTALAAAALQEFDGRFLLGLGTGHPDAAPTGPAVGATVARLSPPGNLATHGIPYSPPVARMREFLDCVLAVLRSPRGELVERVGDYFRVRWPAMGLGRTRVPVLLGAAGERMTSLAAEKADGLITHMLMPKSAVAARQAMAPEREPFSQVAGVRFAVHQDEAQALRLARADLLAAFHTDEYLDRLGWIGEHDVREHVAGLIASGSHAEAAEALPEQVVREFIIVCTPDRVLDEIAAYDAADVIIPVPVFGFAALPGLLGTDPRDIALVRGHLVDAVLK